MGDSGGLGPRSADELPVPIYLNQRTVFDLLAIFEDGLIQVERLESVSGAGGFSEQMGELGARAGLSFFGVRLRGDARHRSDSNQSLTTTSELVHTPTSLCARLIGYLREGSLLTNLAADGPLPSPGDFVEFAGELRVNPLSETLKAIGFVLDAISVFQNTSGRSTPGGKRQTVASQSLDFREIKRQLAAIQQLTDAPTTIDLIGAVLPVRTTTALITTEPEFFVDRSMSAVLDGTFRVVGKVTKVAADDDAKLSMARGSALSRTGSPKLTEMLEGVIGALEQFGPAEPLRVEISAPAVQVIPLAIFV
ncbi:MAG: hypothetical protein R3B97_05840 [Dehalococcoidia bacterium]|nr:hypothetical protein [Dehalococcoidia bacterium]MCB9486299.1 hypothetical protein [Thermoflexaceae bacterium]